MIGSMRVAFVVDSFRVGGTEVNAAKTAECLVSLGIDLTIFHLASDGLLKSRFESLRVPMYPIPIRSLYYPSTIRAGLRLAKFVRELGIDIVHTHDIYTNIFAIPYLRLATDARLIASRRWGNSVFGTGLSVLNRVSYKLAHRVLCNSRGVAEQVRNTDGVPAEKISILPNFVSDAAFSAPEKESDIRQQLSIPEEAVVVGIVARLEPVKNHSMLLHAIADLGSTVHLVVVGTGSLLESLTVEARELGIESRVHFVGQMPPGDGVHHEFDIIALSSDDEGFPNSLVEGMAACKPVVATDVGGVPDAIEDQVNGILVARADQRAMANAIARLADDAGLRREMGHVGQSRARSEFGQQAILGQLTATYEAVLEGGR